MITKKEIHEISHEVVWQGKKMTFKTGKLAPHCDGSVVVSMEGTTLLVTAVMEKNPDLNK
jgi:polyribonucleotide nucleotidyltransferase